MESCISNPSIFIAIEQFIFGNKSKCNDRLFGCLEKCCTASRPYLQDVKLILTVTFSIFTIFICNQVVGMYMKVEC